MKKNYRIVINDIEFKYSLDSKYLVDSLATIIAIWYNDRGSKYDADLIRVITTLSNEIAGKEKDFSYWNLIDVLMQNSFEDLPLRIDKYEE